MMESARARWLTLAGIAVLAGVFAFLNRGERAAVHLGIWVFYQVSLVALVFVAFLLGMVTMFLLGLRHDLQVRRALRTYRIEEPSPRPVATSPPPDP